MKNVRSSQSCISMNFLMNSEKHKFFPVSIVKIQVSFFKDFRVLVYKKDKCAKEKHYVQDLLEEVFLQKSSGKYYKLPGIPKLAKNIATIEKPDKEEAVKSM